MRIERATLDDCAEAGGAVVVIDVIRAFTTAAFAFAAGAAEIVPVGTIEEAQALRAARPESLLIGEVGGYPPPGFDFGNSPVGLLGRDLAGRRLVQRTGAGTQGLVRSLAADTLLAASFVCAGATASYLRWAAPPIVTLVATGVFADRDGDEDLACADYLASLLRGEEPDPQPFLDRVRASDAARLFESADHPAFPRADIELCAAVSRFPFAMPVERRDGGLVMRAIPVEQ